MKKVIIAGGGITGLTTALALQKLDIPYLLFEKTAKFAPVGAGITMAPNAMKVFDWLGIAEKVKENGIQLQRASISDSQLRLFRKSIKSVLTTASGLEITAIHRAALQEILAAQVLPENIMLGQEYLRHESHAQGIKVFFSQAEAEGSILLGADGIHSKVRQAIFTNTALRYSGQTCWRGVSNIELDDTIMLDCIEAWGKKQRFGMAKIAKNQVYWFAVQSSEANGKDQPETLKKDLKALFASFHPLVQEIIEKTPDKAIIRTDICDLKRLDSWHKEKVCLLGDAGHATTPNMGQGGAQGVEDAYYIGHLLKKYGLGNEAFVQFEKLRRPKVDSIVNNSWRFGQWAHSPWMQPILKTVLQWTPESSLANQMQKVFSLDEKF